MARPGLEPGTPRFSVVLPYSLNPSDLQAILVVIQGSRAFVLSQILRPFRGRYGRRQGRSAFSLGRLRGSGHEHERVDVTRLDRCEVAVVEGGDGVELAALGERDDRGVHDAEGQVSYWSASSAMRGQSESITGSTSSSPRSSERAKASSACGPMRSPSR
jgi:hypothetical protein